jgi:hypothetical protein
MKPEGSLPCSHEPTTGPYPNQMNRAHAMTFYFFTTTLILSSNLRLHLASCLFPSGFTTTILR